MKTITVDMVEKFTTAKLMTAYGLDRMFPGGKFEMTEENYIKANDWFDMLWIAEEYFGLNRHTAFESIERELSDKIEECWKKCVSKRSSITEGVCSGKFGLIEPSRYMEMWEEVYEEYNNEVVILYNKAGEKTDEVLKNFFFSS